MSKQPDEKLTEGNVHCAIWTNKGPKGDFKSATISLRYKDKASGDWKDGSSYGTKDLENLEKIAREARARMTKKSAPIDTLDA